MPPNIRPTITVLAVRFDLVIILSSLPGGPAMSFSLALSQLALFAMALPTMRDGADVEPVRHETNLY